jgi:hypothetical protein
MTNEEIGFLDLTTQKSDKNSSNLLPAWGKSILRPVPQFWRDPHVSPIWPYYSKRILTDDARSEHDRRLLLCRVVISRYSIWEFVAMACISATQWLDPATK